MATNKIAWLFLICLINVADGSPTGADSSPTGDSNRSTGDVIKNALTNIINKGLSMLTTSCQINVENLSDEKLTQYKGISVTGELEEYTKDIEPKHTETVKSRSSTMKFFRGTSGIISWEIENKNIRVVIMWRLKAFKVVHTDKNTLWIALIPTSSFNINELKNLVEEDAEVPAELNMKKGIFTSGKPMKTLVVESESFTLTGVLGTGKNPSANIKLASKKSSHVK